MITIRIQMFARARDLAEASEVTLTLPEGATVADLKKQLREEFPALKELLSHCAVAVNNDFAKDEQQVQEKDEIALLPPVSGGSENQPFHTVQET